jgi:hypothetical protein
VHETAHTSFQRSLGQSPRAVNRNGKYLATVTPCSPDRAMHHRIATIDKSPDNFWRLQIRVDHLDWEPGEPTGIRRIMHHRADIPSISQMQNLGDPRTNKSSSTRDQNLRAF